MPLPKFLVDRYIDWKVNSFSKNQKWYEINAKEGQKPKAMIISCCDSRVHATSIFGADIGEFFIHRNIANLVPTYKLDSDHQGTFAAIEFAVKTLKVPNIIILGHSNCGGIEYGYHTCSGEKEKKYEFVDKWLEILKPAFTKVNSIDTNKDKISLLEKESIKNSIKNLLDFPFIKDLVSKEEINIYGLWYNIATGELMNLDLDNNKFEQIN